VLFFSPRSGTYPIAAAGTLANTYKNTHKNNMIAKYHAGIHGQQKTRKAHTVRVFEVS